MSEFDRKYAAAIQELKATNMHPVSCRPYIHRFFKVVGLKVRPSHYTGFFNVLFVEAMFLAGVWAMVMLLIHRPGIDLRLMLKIAVLVGALLVPAYRGCMRSGAGSGS